VLAGESSHLLVPVINPPFADISRHFAALNIFIDKFLTPIFSCDINQKEGA